MREANKFFPLLRTVGRFVAVVAAGTAVAMFWFNVDLFRKTVDLFRKDIPNFAKRKFASDGKSPSVLKRAADFLADDRTRKSVEKWTDDFKAGTRREQRKGAPLFSTMLRRAPGSENDRRMFLRQFAGCALVSFFLGLAAGGFGVKVSDIGFWPTLLGGATGIFAVWIALFVLLWPVMTILVHQMRCFHLGLVGEMKMAQHLERMASKPGFLIFHGIDIGFGDIDHVFVYPKGVFCFEVKALAPKYDGEDTLYYKIGENEKSGTIFRKNEDGEKTPLPRDPLRQAAGNAWRLHAHIAEKTGEEPGFVKRIVYFPEWKVEREGEHEARHEFVSGDPDEIRTFLNSLVKWRDEELSEEENREKILARIEKIRAALEDDNRKKAEEIPPP